MQIYVPFPTISSHIEVCGVAAILIVVFYKPWQTQGLQFFSASWLVFAKFAWRLQAVLSTVKYIETNTIEKMAKIATAIMNIICVVLLLNF